MEEEASGPPEAPKAPEGGAQEQVASPEANTDDNPPPAIKVGDVVMVQGEDEQYQERKVLEVSTRSHKRQMQVVYRVSPPDGVGRKGKSEWVDGSRVERRTPELLAKIKKAQEAQREELEARAIEEELLARRRMEARLRNQGRVLTWWEMIADAIYDMDKDGAGVSVEDMEKYVEATYDQRGKNAQKQVVNTVEAGLLDKRIVVTEDDRYKLSTTASRKVLASRAVSRKSPGLDDMGDADDGVSSLGGGDDDEGSARSGRSGLGGGGGRRRSPVPPDGLGRARGPPPIGPPPAYPYHPPGMPPHAWKPGYPMGPQPYYNGQLGMYGGPPGDPTMLGETASYRAYFQAGGGPPRGPPGDSSMYDDAEALVELKKRDQSDEGGRKPAALPRAYPGLSPMPNYFAQRAAGLGPPPPGGLMYGAGLAPGLGAPSPGLGVPSPGLGAPSSSGFTDPRSGSNFRLPGVTYDPMGFPQGSVGPMGLLEQSRSLSHRDDFGSRSTQGGVLVGSLAAAVMSGPPGLHCDDDEDDDDDGEGEDFEDMSRRWEDDAARRRAAAASARRRRQELRDAELEAVEAEEKQREEEERNLLAFKRSSNELKSLRKRMSTIGEGVAVLKSQKKQLMYELAEAERKLNARQTRWENKELKAAEAQTVQIPDDLDTIATDTRRRNLGKAPAMPEPQMLTCPQLPSRCIADVLHVWDFVKLHASALSLEPFPVLHLLLALGLSEGSLIKEMQVIVPTGHRHVVDPGTPGPHFLKEQLMAFLRILCYRDPRTGESLNPKLFETWSLRNFDYGVTARWMPVLTGWSEVLNPFTISEVLRRFLASLKVEPAPTEGDDAPPAEVLPGPSNYSPYGESFLHDAEDLRAGTEALLEKELMELPPELLVCLLRNMVDALLERPLIQECIQNRLDMLNEVAPKLIEAEKEQRRAKKELNKAGGGGKDGTKESNEVKQLNERFRATQEQVEKMQLAYEEAERAVRRIHLQPLGEDRYRNQYWYMADEPRLYVHLKSSDVTGLSVPPGFNKKLCPPWRPPGGEWAVYTDEGTLQQLLDSLHPRATRESQLQRRLFEVFEPLVKCFQRAFKMRQQYNPPPELPEPEPADLKSQASEGDQSAARRSLRGRAGAGEEEDDASMEISTVADESSTAENGGVTRVKSEANGSLEQSGSSAGGVKVEDLLDVPLAGKVKRGRSTASTASSSAAGGASGEASDAMADDEAEARRLAEEEEDGLAASAPAPAGRRGRGSGAAVKHQGPAHYVPMKPPHSITFEEALDPLECFRKEMMTIEAKLWDTIRFSTVLRMCTNGTKEQRAKWHEDVTQATQPLQLMEPLVQLEALFAQALGYDCALDEALKLYNALPSKKKKKPEEGRKKRRGRKPKPIPPRRKPAAPPQPPPGQEPEQQPQPQEGSAAPDAAAPEAQKEEDAMAVDGANGEASAEATPMELSENGDEAGKEGAAESSDEEDEEGEDDDEDDDEEDEDDEDDDEEEAAPPAEEEEEEAKPKPKVGQKRPKSGGGRGAGGGGGRRNSSKGGRPAKRPKSTPAAADVAAAPPVPIMPGLPPAAVAAVVKAPEDELGLEKSAAESNAEKEDEAKARKELQVIYGPLSGDGREVWAAEVQACKTVSALALCLYAFSRAAQEQLPRLKVRVEEVTAREKGARESLRSGADAVQLSLPTVERLNVVWAKLPKGIWWPALVHTPYSRSLRRLLREKGQNIVRFIGETPVYHLSKAEQLPFLNEQGAISVEIKGKGKAMDKALKVGHQLWARQMERHKEVGGGPFEGDEEEVEDEDDDDDETEDEMEPRGRARASLSSTDTEGEERAPRRRNSRGAPARERKSTGEAGAAAGATDVTVTASGRTARARRR